MLATMRPSSAPEEVSRHHPKLAAATTDRLVTKCSPAASTGRWIIFPSALFIEPGDSESKTDLAWRSDELFRWHRGSDLVNDAATRVVAKNQTIRSQ